MTLGKLTQKFTEIRSKFLCEIAKFKVKMKGWSYMPSRNESHLSLLLSKV